LQRNRERPLSGLALTGSISANRLLLGRVTASHLTADLTVEESKVQLSHVRAALWGGQHNGEWQLDFSGRQPIYSGAGTLDRAALAQLSTAMGDDWASGGVSLRYHMKAAGWTKTDLGASLVSAADFDVRDAVLRHITLAAGAKPLRARRFTGQLALKDGEFTLHAGKLLALDGIYQVSGTALVDSKLNIKLVRDSAHAFDITGTLGAPRVVPASRPQTEAALTK
jgi:hypothetical protein